MPEVTLSQALSRWFEVRLATGSWCRETAKNARCIWRRYQRILGNPPLTAIRPAHIEDLFLDTRHRSPAYANYRRAMVCGFFEWAWRKGLIRRDPTVDIWPHLQDTAEPVFRTLNREEERKLCGIMPRALARFLVLAVATGLRIGTLYQLVWAWVAADWTLDIPAKALKNRRPIRIPLNKRAIEALGRRREPAELLLPGLPHKDLLNKRLRYWARKAGVSPKNLTSRQLRKTWVERFRDAGGTREECQLIQGWRSSSVLLFHYFPRVPVARARSILEKI